MTTAREEGSVTQTGAPSSWRSRLGIVGPGLVVAATGVGAGDLVASLAAGSRFGLALLWAILLGAVLKFALTEALGRWHLSSGQTILKGWNSLGRGATGYVAVYMVIWAFVYGGAVSSSVGLASTTMFPILPLWSWGIIHMVVGFALIWIGRYGLFENIIKVLVGFMFITVVGTAVLVSPALANLEGGVASGLVPRLPEGSLLYAIGLLGGVGGTITLASYGYWLKEKDWRGTSWLPVMRLDSATAYIVTTVFILAMLVIGTALLFNSGTQIDSEQGLVNVSEPLGEQFGPVLRWLFLMGFWAASFTSLLGVWNGVPYLFADLVRIMRRIPDEESAEHLSEKSPAYRGFLVWLTFPPMILLALGQPVGLIIVYSALGALFMPFLAATLIWLLNSQRVSSAYSNGIVSNVALGITVAVFVILAVQQIVGLL
jgi:Mn2+/Fe2+ NRAMP family transporter